MVEHLINRRFMASTSGLVGWKKFRNLGCHELGHCWKSGSSLVPLDSSSSIRPQKLRTEKFNYATSWKFDWVFSRNFNRTANFLETLFNCFMSFRANALFGLLCDHKDALKAMINGCCGIGIKRIPSVNSSKAVRWSAVQCFFQIAASLSSIVEGSH